MRPDPRLEVFSGLYGKEIMIITGSIGLCLTAEHERGFALIPLSRAVDQEHWRRLWRRHNPGAVLTWEDGTKAQL